MGEQINMPFNPIEALLLIFCNRLSIRLTKWLSVNWSDLSDSPDLHIKEKI